MIALVKLVASVAPLLSAVQAQGFSWVPLSGPVPSGSSSGPGTRMRPTIGVRSPEANAFEFFVFGGTRVAPASGVTNDLWRFDSRTGVWTQHCNGTTGFPVPEARFDAIGGYLAHAGGSYFVIGSGQAGSTFFADVWVCDLNAGQWHRLDGGSPLTPAGRYGVGGGLIGSVFYMTHGFSTVRYSDTLKFDVGEALVSPNLSGDWEELVDGISLFNPFAPHARCVMGITNRDPFLYIYGGCANQGETGGPCPANDFWRFDVNSKEWERLRDGPVPVMVSDLGFLQDGNRVVLYGGMVKPEQVVTQKPEANANDLHVYNVRDDEWTTYHVNVPGNWDASKATAWEKMVELDGANVTLGGLSVQLLMFGGINQPFTGQIFGLVENPAEPARTRGGWYYFSMVHLHGVFMFVGWGVFLQFGAFAFRYFRHHQSKWAWMAHRGAQSFGLLLAIVGFILSFYTDGDFKFSHAGIGIAVMVLGVLNPINALFRCHPGGKSLLGCGFAKRWIFNLMHHLIGRAALVLALINIALGLSMSQAPIGWWIAYMVWLGVIVLAYVVCELLRLANLLPRIPRGKEEQYLWGFGDAAVAKKTDEEGSEELQVTTASA